LAEIRDGLEVRRQLPGQPDHLDIALAFPLQASTRRQAIEVAVDVELEHHAGTVAGPPRVEWLNASKAELVQIEPVDEHINRTHRIVLGHVVVEQCREQRALSAINPLHESCHRSSPPIHWRIIAEAEFSHSLGPRRPTVASQHVGRYLGYTGREANPFGKAASTRERIS